MHACVCGTVNGKAYRYVRNDSTSRCSAAHDDKDRTSVLICGDHEPPASRL